ncbi:MAG: beta-ketoacyl-[acyl-carrier-protein] synthase family protein [Candidatus Omnitrophica bacterium]|nr:beta-ketoacyl-[acyl-carrier-protein] synthase family protein [Candidatus Omnitrophota bacterium]MBU4479517.1 beta-ketoacyl-[acyl-carrier-protein] synthase family protein [Candidatus Omnitrophota bacterium]
MKNELRIVITGIGVIAPNGIGKDAFWQALQEGISGIRPILSIDTTYFKSKLAAECADFNAAEFLGAKGLRNLDRATLLVTSAAKLALDDAGLEISEANTDDIGVATATTLSVAVDIAAFTKEVVDDGAQMVNPALFPPTTMNFPSSHIAIRYKIKGFNSTISTGYTAGLDALKYAMDLIKAGRARAALVAGVESFSFANFVGFYKAGFLSGRRGEELCCPFDNRRNGIILGEAATVIVVEDEEFARQRQARIYARVLGVKSFFDAYRSADYAPKSRGLKQSMVKVLEEARLSEEDIDYICSAANSVKQQDKLETEAIKEVFNIYAEQIPVSSIKSMVGESISAAGCLQIAASVAAITKGFIPPTINYEVPDPECDLDYVPNVSRKADVKNVLINNFGPGGNNAAAVISRYE